MTIMNTVRHHLSILANIMHTCQCIVLDIDVLSSGTDNINANDVVRFGFQRCAHIIQKQMGDVSSWLVHELHTHRICTKLFIYMGDCLAVCLPHLIMPATRFFLLLYVNANSNERARSLTSHCASIY